MIDHDRQDKEHFVKKGFGNIRLKRGASKGTHAGRRAAKTKPTVFLITFAVILIIGGVIVFNTFNHTKQSTVYIDLLNINDAVELFALDHQAFPNDLQILWDPPESEQEGKIYLDWEPIDPWGNPYVYEVNGMSGYELKSLGADGRQGGIGEAEDITIDDAKAAIQERAYR